MSRLSSAREPINPKDQIQLPIDAYPGGRNDAQNLDAQSLIRAAQGTRPFSRFLQAIPLLQNSCKSLGVRALPKSQVLEMCARSPCQGVSAEISTGDWVECALPPPPCYHGPHGRKNCRPPLRLPSSVGLPEPRRMLLSSLRWRVKFLKRRAWHFAKCHEPARRCRRSAHYGHQQVWFKVMAPRCTFLAATFNPAVPGSACVSFAQSSGRNTLTLPFAA